MINVTPHTHCRACGASLPEPFLDLGEQPLANNLCTDTEHCDDVFPMRLCRCVRCGLLQLDRVIDPAVLFSHYLYTPSQSKKTLAHFEELAGEATKRVASNSLLAVDVGSNDGALLSMLQRRGWNVCGVDPAENLAKQANDAGLPTVVGFFDDIAVDGILHNHGQTGLITACNVFAHSPDWGGFAKCAARLLAPDGLLAIEFPYGPQMLKDGTADLVYWEHASFPSIGPLAHLFGRYGMRVLDVEDLPNIHGGSVRVWIGKQGDVSSAVADKFIDEDVVSSSVEACVRFVEKVERTKRELRDAVRTEIAAGRRVVGYTAPAKCVTLLTAAELGAKDVAFIIDDNPLKQGRMLPKLHIPIIAPKEAIDPRFARTFCQLAPNDTVIIFAWNVAEDIVSKLPPGVDVIVPMPDVRVIRR